MSQSFCAPSLKLRYVRYNFTNDLVTEFVCKQNKLLLFSELKSIVCVDTPISNMIIYAICRANMMILLLNILLNSQITFSITLDLCDAQYV